jgi:pimeloyl-ACP methyl ester carboxylesterase
VDVNEVELSGGVIEYEDTGGDGPVLVFLHGVTMDGSLWRHVVASLCGDFRCIVPTLPLGGHHKPMKPDADLSLTGIAALVGEFVERLGLNDVILIQNDWGGIQILLAVGDTSRLARLIITSSEAFCNYPPPPGRAIALAARIPGGLVAMMQALRFTAVRRAPGSWAWMSKRPVPKAVMDEWFRPATTSREIRRDLAKYATSVPPRPRLLEMAQRSAEFDRPVLIVWAAEDRVMPVEHGRKLAALFPNAKLIEIDDSYTLIPEDQPEKLAEAIREFITG